MRHQNTGRKFSRSSSHRAAMFRNMVTSLNRARADHHHRAQGEGVASFRGEDDLDLSAPWRDPAEQDQGTAHTGRTGPVCPRPSDGQPHESGPARSFISSLTTSLRSLPAAPVVTRGSSRSVSATGDAAPMAIIGWCRRSPRSQGRQGRPDRDRHRCRHRLGRVNHAVLTDREASEPAE